MTENEKTAPNEPTAIGMGQSSTDNSIIAQSDEKSDTDFYKMMVKQMIDPMYLPTISMPELYENVYDSKPTIIDGLLYAGTYLFVGAPKVGKSFFMLQLAYHVSTGKNYGNIPSVKARCCISRWNMITTDCKKGYTECSERIALPIYTSR